MKELEKYLNRFINKEWGDGASFVMGRVICYWVDDRPGNNSKINSMAMDELELMRYDEWQHLARSFFNATEVSNAVH